MPDTDLTKNTKEYHVLPCKMSEKELADENVTLLDILQRIEDLEITRKAQMADLKAQKEKLIEIMEDSRKKLRSKQIMRSIECDLLLNMSRLTATLRRRDTDEVVVERSMTPEERDVFEQPTLFGEDEPEFDMPPGGDE